MDTPPLPEIPKDRRAVAGDIRWERLDAHQRADVERCVRIALLYEQAHAIAGTVRGAMPLAQKWVAELGLSPPAARDGRKLQRSGLSRNSFYRLHRITKDGGWSWADVARYQWQIKDKAGALREVELDPETVRYFLSLHGGLTAWCRANGVEALAMRELLATNRAGSDPASIAKTLRAAITASRGKASAELTRLRSQRAKLSAEICRLERIAENLSGLD